MESDDACIRQDAGDVCPVAYDWGIMDQYDKSGVGDIRLCQTSCVKDPCPDSQGKEDMLPHNDIVET